MMTEEDVARILALVGRERALEVLPCLVPRALIVGIGAQVAGPAAVDAIDGLVDILAGGRFEELQRTRLFSPLDRHATTALEVGVGLDDVRLARVVDHRGEVELVILLSTARIGKVLPRQRHTALNLGARRRRSSSAAVPSWSGCDEAGEPHEGVANRVGRCVGRAPRGLRSGSNDRAGRTSRQ
jgi:hypothetical protein